MGSYKIELSPESRSILSFKTQAVANAFGMRNLCLHNDLGKVLGNRNEYYGTIENPFEVDFKAGFLNILYDEDMAAAAKSIGSKKCLNDIILQRNHSEVQIVENSIKNTMRRIGYKLQDEETEENRNQKYFTFHNPEKNKSLEIELTSNIQDRENFFYVTVFGIEED